MNNVNPPASEIIIQNNLESNYDFGAVKRIPFYFGTEDKPLLGWLHTTDSKQHSNTGVIICPPLAVEYMNSYRSMRYVADYFALAGIPAIRFDYHGTGDSSGLEEDENRLENWLWSINQGIEQLKTTTGCKNFGLFGFRIGATLAALVAEKTPVEFLVLWAALNSGKKYIREIKLIQMTSKVQFDDNSLLEAGGMGYWEKTAIDISKINLLKITPQSNRTLIIPRDEQKNDTELYDTWSKELKVEQQYHVGSTLMLVDAHQTIVPHETIQNIVQWVKEDLSKTLITNNFKSITNKIESFTDILYVSSFNSNHHKKDTLVKESIFYYGDNNQNIAILSETETSKTANLPTIIISNSGANHRVGPSRLYVLIARELSLMGFRCLRIDVPGIGDSVISDQRHENIEYITSSSNKISDLINKLNDNSYKDQYILMGLCSGAYFSFHAALELNNSNIIESILINPLTFYWEDGMTENTSSTQNFSIWNWYKQAIASKKSWIKLFKGKIDFKSLVMAIKDRIKIKFTSKFSNLKMNTVVKDIDRHREQLSSDLTKITNKNTRLQFILSRSDPGFDILMVNAGKTVRSLRKDDKLGILFIEDADHTFSKYRPRCTVINSLINHFKDRYCNNNLHKNI